MAKKVDTIVIGGGVGGTAVGALLASKGRDVELFEKNNLIGGRCTSYTRDGFVVDVGVHLFGLTDKGPLGEVTRHCGEPDAIEWVLAKNPRVSMHFKGKTQAFTQNMMMSNIDKKEMGNLGQLIMNLMQLTDEDLEKLWYVPLLEYLMQFTKDKSALSMFSMLCGIYFCTPVEETSTTEFVHSFRELSIAKSSGYPKGGCIAIPKAYQDIIEKNGGKVHFNAPVEQIMIENGKATGIRVNGEEILADQIISNADIKATIGGLASPEHFPKEYYDRIQALKFTTHVCSLKVALDTKITNEKMIMYMPDLSDEELEKMAKMSKAGEELPIIPGGMFNSPTNFDERLAPEGKQMIFFGTKSLRHQDWKKWGELCMTAFVDVFPDIEKHVLWTNVDSPDTVAHYAGEDGNVIGVGQTVDQIHEKRPKHETPVKGLYLCSSEAGGHGIGTELAASSALELADKLLDKK